MRSESNPVDHRRPNLAQEGVGLYLAAKHLAEATGQCLNDCVASATEALTVTDSGEHRDVVVRALHRFGKSAVSRSSLYAAYDECRSRKVPANAKGLVEHLPDVDGQSICDAVARFESCHHIGLVRMAANRMADFYKRPAEELFDGGWIGLRNGLRTYDPRQGTVSTFVSYRIRGAIQEVVRLESPVNKRLVNFSREVEDVQERLTQALSRVPTQDEIKRELGDHARLMHLYPRLTPHCSLDSLPDHMITADVERDTAEEAQSRYERNVLSGAMQDISPDAARAVKMVIIDGIAPRTAARQVGIRPKELNALVSQGLEELRRSPGVAELAVNA